MSNRMNKKELVKRVSENTSLPQKDVEKTFNIIFDLVKESLVGGEACRLHGIGTFSVKDVPARKGRNPRSGESIQIPAKRRVVFKPASQLAEKVASSYTAKEAVEEVVAATPHKETVKAVKKTKKSVKK